MTSIINSATSFLAGFVVFSFLGYLSVKTCKDFYEVAQEGLWLFAITFYL